MNRQSFILALFLIGFTFPQVARADGWPWWSSENECHQWWFNRGEGCRIRKIQYTNEQPQGASVIATAKADLAAFENPIKDNASKYDRLDEDRIILSEIIIPEIKNRMQLVSELQSILANPNLPELQNNLNILDSLTYLDSKMINMAFISMHETDSFALGMELDALSKNEKSDALKSKSDKKHFTFNTVLKILEKNTKNISVKEHKILETINTINATDVLDLKINQQKLSEIQGELQKALDLKTSTEIAFEKAKKNLSEVESRVQNLPNMTREQENCENEALQYWNGENKCHKYWD